MKKTVTYHFCDVCGRREISGCDRPSDWQLIKYKKTWDSRGHAGVHDEEFLACEACLKEDRKKLFKKLLTLFKLNAQ